MTDDPGAIIDRIAALEAAEGRTWMQHLSCASELLIQAGLTFSEMEQVLQRGIEAALAQEAGSVYVLLVRALGKPAVVALHRKGWLTLEEGGSHPFDGWRPWHCSGDGWGTRSRSGGFGHIRIVRDIELAVCGPFRGEWIVEVNCFPLRDAELNIVRYPSAPAAQRAALIAAYRKLANKLGFVR
jgi:hypothetical protein